MAIEGPIKELGLTDLFQLLSLSEKSGRLTISPSGGHDVFIYFEKGRITFASSDDREYDIGNVLIKKRRMSEEDVKRLRNSLGKDEQLVDGLVSQKLIPSSEIRTYLTKFTEELVYELLKINDGDFRFEEGIPAPSKTVISLRTENIIMEGSRRIDEWSKIREKIPSMDTVVRVSPNIESVDSRDYIESVDSIDFKPDEWSILACIDGKRSISEIVKSVNQNEFDVCKVIYGFLMTGVCELGKGQISLESYLTKGNDYVRGGQYREAIEEYEKALEIDSNNYRLYHSIGQCYAKLNDLNKAVSYWEKYIVLSPSDEFNVKEKIRLARSWKEAIE